MPNAQTSAPMSPGLLKVAERAHADPQVRFTSLAHLIDVPALLRSYDHLRPEAAVGIDGVSAKEYGQHLADHLQDLHARLKAGGYRHQLIRRVYIPKDNKTTRPIGVCTVEDKVVQGAVRDVLEAVYEQDFLACSYGCRPGRGAHDAIRALNRIVYRGEVNWVLEADIRQFFDSLDRAWLRKMLQHRVADEALLRLVGKCLHVGVLDGFLFPSRTAAQPKGRPYLHSWGTCTCITCWTCGLSDASSLVWWVRRPWSGIAMTSSSASRTAGTLSECTQFSRSEWPSSASPCTRTRRGYFRFSVPRPSRLADKAQPRSTSWVFTLFWRRTRNGKWQMACQTRSSRLGRALRSIHDWCRDHRFQPIDEQHRALTRRIRGHLNYFAVNGNFRRLQRLLYWAKRSWHKWLNRRSQRSRLTWARFSELLAEFPFPVPRILVQIWG